MTGVAVEKLDLSDNRPKRGDQKCIGDRRKSFIGHPDATHFRRKFCERVFQQLRLLTTVEKNSFSAKGKVPTRSRVWDSETRPREPLVVVRRSVSGWRGIWYGA